jgi:hypothetical protein
VILRIFNDGRVAEIILEPPSESIGADVLVRVLIAHSVFAAKVIRIKGGKRED